MRTVLRTWLPWSAADAAISGKRAFPNPTAVNRVLSNCWQLCVSLTRLAAQKSLPQNSRTQKISKVTSSAPETCFCEYRSMSSPGAMACRTGEGPLFLMRASRLVKLFSETLHPASPLFGTRLPGLQHDTQDAKRVAREKPVCSSLSTNRPCQKRRLTTV